MKCLGARSSQIMRIYVIQTVVLALIGSGLGILVGLLVQLVFPGSDREILQHPARV